MGTIIFYPVTWPWRLTHFLKMLTLLIIFEQWVLELWYFTWVFLVIRPFHGYHYFLPCDLDLEVWPFFEHFNLANYIWTVSARALIFYMSIPCDKTFPWVPLFSTLWPWHWSLTHFWGKTLTLLITFEWWVLELWYFIWVFQVTTLVSWEDTFCLTLVFCFGNEFMYGVWNVTAT